MLIAPPAALITLSQPWADFYNDSKLAETLVMFAHTGGLLVAGGLAVSTDRRALRAASWNADEKRRHLGEMASIHRAVVGGLVAIVISGLLMFAADVETFWGSWVYWVKMALVVLLLANGLWMQRVERELAGDASGTSAAWGSMRTSSLLSLMLWLAITLAGVALLNYA